MTIKPVTNEQNNPIDDKLSVNARIRILDYEMSNASETKKRNKNRY
jgi:hypothetical protein